MKMVCAFWLASVIVLDWAFVTTTAKSFGMRHKNKAIDLKKTKKTPPFVGFPMHDFMDNDKR